MFAIIDIYSGLTSMKSLPSFTLGSRMKSALRGHLRQRFAHYVLVACALIGSLGGIRAIRAENPDEHTNPPAQVIEISAKKYDFTPDEIRVKSGAMVELKIHSIDETHGIKLDLHPEGSTDQSSPGLIFDNPEDNGRVEKNHDQILDFVALQPGTYEFKCAKVCGIHHGRMKGTLIVEE
jgi:heme/copper-type cytochrome/quinol oxidase subunit 2